MSLVKLIERSKREKESWRYTPVEKLLADFNAKAKGPVGKIEKPIRQSSSPSLVFIDGVWQSELSHLGALPADILQGDARKGYRLILAGQTCLVTQPVELLFVTEKARESAVKFYIELGQSGRLTLVERHEAAAGASVQIVDNEIILHPQAKLVHGKMVSAHEEQAHIAMTDVKIAEGAYFDSFNFVSGGKLVRNEITATLQGKLAQCNLNGLMLLKNQEHADTTTRIIHAAPHGASRQIYKTVLANKARGVFQGKVVVAEDAQKTDSQQLSRALLLSDQAEMDAKPELEIYADDVKCSHGATVGDLDSDALFYLRARGVSEQEARALLVQAFAEDIVNEIHNPEWRELCRAEVEGWCYEQN